MMQELIDYLKDEFDETYTEEELIAKGKVPIGCTEIYPFEYEEDLKRDGIEGIDLDEPIEVQVYFDLKEKKAQSYLNGMKADSIDYDSPDFFWDFGNFVFMNDYSFVKKVIEGGLID